MFALYPLYRWCRQRRWAALVLVLGLIATPAWSAPPDCPLTMLCDWPQSERRYSLRVDRKPSPPAKKRCARPPCPIRS